GAARLFVVFFFQAEDGIRDRNVTGVQTCALPISTQRSASGRPHNSALGIGAAAQLSAHAPGASEGSGSPNRWCSAIRAACHPLMPCTPGPGGVDWEHKYTPGIPAAYGFVVGRGRASIPHADIAPAAMSPPT